MATLFISDLHLCRDRPYITDLFLEFLRHRAQASDALYILGDLFEYWIGDDGAGFLGYEEVTAGIQHLIGNGTPVYVMHGNRDFLLGEQFCEQTGCKLVPDPTKIHLYGQAILLMHGDSLCTDDVEHQQFRTQVRKSEWQTQFLGKPLSERNEMALALRRQSERNKTQKTIALMDVTQGTVERIMREHEADVLVHGHTHRPAIHDVLLGDRTARRIVLGDWYEQGSVLEWSQLGYSLQMILR